MSTKQEIAIGREKGRKSATLPKRIKPSNKKGHSSKRIKFIREIIKEVSGQAPYEKRAIEYLKIGKEKKCTKFLKQRLGSLRRAKRKRDELSALLLSMKRKHD